MASPIVEAHGLAKRFGKVEALAGLDLVAHSGQVVAVLGPNGAGKTTFVHTIATLVRPDAGSLRVDGIDVARQPDQVRRIIGLAGQYAAVEEAMTGREKSSRSTPTGPTTWGGWQAPWHPSVPSHHVSTLPRAA